MNDVDRRRMIVVVKTSKFCNLRCTYCYEYDELDDRTRLGVDDLRVLYRNLRAYLDVIDRRDHSITAVDFVWHGGEPLLVEPDFYRSTIADMKRLLTGRELTNVVQTNLTMLGPDRLRLLRDDFDSVGVSFDVFGGLRVNVAGRDSRDRVEQNMLKLRDGGVGFGCITVLTAANIHLVDQIFDFYETRGIDFRLLPLFNEAFADQHDSIEVDNQSIADVFCHLFDRWLASPSNIDVTPLNEYTRAAINHLTGTEVAYYDRSSRIDVLLVNTDGRGYLLGDPFDVPEYAVANVFSTPLLAAQDGPAFARSVAAGELRMAANCTSCDFFGGCDGNFAATAEVAERDVLDGSLRACTIPQAVIEHITRRLEQIPALDLHTVGRAAPHSIT